MLLIVCVSVCVCVRVDYCMFGVCVMCIVNVCVHLCLYEHLCICVLGLKLIFNYLQIFMFKNI